MEGEPLEQRYRPISDYAIIGNGQTTALVSSEGSIDWCCWPRFDSAPVFCKLLDDKKGGSFAVRPTGGYRVHRAYLDLTNVLRTTFTADSGVLQVTDLMPAPLDQGDDPVFPHRIIRRLVCTQGQIEVKLCLHSTFNWAATSAEINISENGATVATGDEALVLVTSASLEAVENKLVGHKKLQAGEECWLILTHTLPESTQDALGYSHADADVEYQRTLTYWQNWAGKCRYDGYYHEQVIRSALALKLLVFQPTGGIVAAPTSSLPAEIGGVRNWDYRYTWLRDSGLVLDALQCLGYHDESIQFIEWLENLCLCDGDDLSVLYTVDGKAAPQESVISHLDGYRGSKPVRSGNGAVGQSQIDRYGHLIDAIILCYERMPREMKSGLWEFIQKLLRHIEDQWREPDHGPWEIRGPKKNYLYSKIYCWVGLDRAIQYAERLSLPGDIETWKQIREEVRNEILEHGYNEAVGAFTQAFGGSELDASVLTIPLVHFLPATDERVRATIRAVEKHLTNRGFVYRYVCDDGLAGKDASFNLCSFWLVNNLALSGQVEKAKELFEKICAYRNNVGLLSEQIDPESGEALGNFPQGFTHLALIRTALTLDKCMRENESSID